MSKKTINLRELRERRGWTQVELAERLGFSRPFVSEVENGKRGISLGMMQAIMRVFNLKYEDFFANEGRRGSG